MDKEESRNHKSSFIFEMEPLNQGITEEEDDDRVEDKAADGLDWEVGVSDASFARCFAIFWNIVKKLHR